MLALEVVLTIGLLVAVSGSALILRPRSPAAGFAMALAVCSLWATIVFWVALLGGDQWFPSLSWVALATGVAGWCHWLWVHREAAGLLRLRSSAKVMAAGLSVGCAALIPAVSFSLVQVGADPFASARVRYVGLYSDNEIPALLARGIESGTYLRPLVGDWLGSDRPPLQSGFILLLKPLLETLGLSSVAADYSVSYTVQLAWIVGLAVLLAGCGFSMRFAGVAVLTVSLTGLVVVNTVFTWPKLLSAGLLLATAGLLMHAPRLDTAKQRWKAMALAGLLLGFSLQSHGTAAFAVPGLLLMGWLLLRQQGVRERIGNLATLVAIAVTLQIPWYLWARIADPPGDRLLKWHLAGVGDIDDRPFLRALIDAYSNLGFNEWVSLKVTNLHTLVSPPGGPFRPLASATSLTDPVAARNADFFSVLPALSWLLPLLLVAAVAGLRSRAFRRTMSTAAAAFALPLLWILVTVLFWVLAIFGPNATVVHQGSAVMIIVPIVTVGIAVAVASADVWLAGVAGQFILWAFAYMRADQQWDNPRALVLVAVLTCLAAVAARWAATGQRDAAPLLRTATATGAPEAGPT